MTFKAREVLDDCRVLLEMLEEETDLQKWRIHWAGALSLIRAVGHALDKFDGRYNALIKEASNKAMKDWKNPSIDKHLIFQEFIEYERNNILKEYEFNVHPLEEVQVAVQWHAQNTQTGEIKKINEVIPISENIYRPVMSGPWEGHDARDVYTEAIAWWDEQLDSIDKVISIKP